MSRHNHNPLVKAKYVLRIFLVAISFAILSLLKLELDIAQKHKSNIAATSPNDEEVSYSLAKEQSFGYFTDITNENWRIAQRHHASLFPNYYADLTKFSNGPNDKGQYNKLVKARNHMWYGENFQVEFICPLARRLPSDSVADGPKWICDPHRLAKKKDCLVYSIGSNGKNEFEKAVKEEIGEHCEVHSKFLFSFLLHWPMDCLCVFWGAAFLNLSTFESPIFPNNCTRGNKN